MFAAKHPINVIHIGPTLLTISQTLQLQLCQSGKMRKRKTVTLM